MKEYIKQLAEEYARQYDELNEEEIKYITIDFTAGIYRVLQHPEEFGLQTKEYE